MEDKDKNVKLQPMREIPNRRIYKAIPLAFDESLSWLEELSSMLYKINEVIEQTNQNTDDIETINNTIKVIQNTLVDLQEQITSNDNDIEALQNRCTNVENDIKIIKSNLDYLLNDLIGNETSTWKQNQEYPKGYIVYYYTEDEGKYKGHYYRNDNVSDYSITPNTENSGWLEEDILTHLNYLKEDIVHGLNNLFARYMGLRYGIEGSIGYDNYSDDTSYSKGDIVWWNTQYTPDGPTFIEEKLFKSKVDNNKGNKPYVDNKLNENWEVLTLEMLFNDTSKNINTLNNNLSTTNVIVDSLQDNLNNLNNNVSDIANDVDSLNKKEVLNITNPDKLGLYITKGQSEDTKNNTYIGLDTITNHTGSVIHYEDESDSYDYTPVFIMTNKNSLIAESEDSIGQWSILTYDSIGYADFSTQELEELGGIVNPWITINSNATPVTFKYITNTNDGVGGTSKHEDEYYVDYNNSTFTVEKNGNTFTDFKTSGKDLYIKFDSINIGYVTHIIKLISKYGNNDDDVLTNLNRAVRINKQYQTLINNLSDRKQDKLIAGDNIVINPVNNVITATCDSRSSGQTIYKLQDFDGTQSLNDIKFITPICVNGTYNYDYMYVYYFVNQNTRDIHTITIPLKITGNRTYSEITNIQMTDTSIINSRLILIINGSNITKFSELGSREVITTYSFNNQNITTNNISYNDNLQNISIYRIEVK